MPVAEKSVTSHGLIIFNTHNTQTAEAVDTQRPRARESAGPFLFAQHERTLTGASPQTALIVGRLQPKARVPIVRWNLKEAGGKRLAR